MIEIIKRNGTKESYNPGKIKAALKAAFSSLDYTLDENTYDEIIETIEIWPEITVEDIQDEVIEALRDFGYDEVADAYLIYKAKHDETRKFIQENIDYMMSYINSSENAAGSSATDSNANITLKNVSNLEAEVPKVKNRLIQRAWVKRALKELYPELTKQYEEDLKNHIIYVHDEASTPTIKNYCEAVTLYPLAVDGTSTMDGTGTKAPKHLISFAGQIQNLLFLLSAQCKGAVAFGEFFNFFDYYAAKDFGPEYHRKADVYADSEYVVNRQTIGQKIDQTFQQIVFYWNQPAGNRGAQSPFSNISYYDSNYWKALFEDFYFPDGTQPVWERVDWLQKRFMRWFNEERSKTLLTFPVETMALLTDGKDVIDQDYKNFSAEMWSKGHSFFMYLSNNPDSLASCCFSKDTKVLWKSSTKGVNLTTLEELHKTKWEPDKKNLRIFHNGSWVVGKSIKLPNREMYKVTTYNNKEYYMTDNHINVTLDGEKTTINLTTDDYLMFNTQALHAIPENNEHLSFAQGFIVGEFLGDGSFGPTMDNGVIYETIISQNKTKKGNTIKALKVVLKQMGLDNNVRIDEPHNNVYNVRVSCKEIVAFIQKWTCWKRGTSAHNKKLNLNCLLQSVDFRRGILAGWYNTDGGNSNRCYTTSPELAEDMEALITSLGMNSIIDISDRTDEKIIIREEEYNRNYPLYCVRWYESANHRMNKDSHHSWIKKNNSIYFRIKSIEKVNYKDDVYCIECKDAKEPYFTLPSGLITHNCRLRNKIQENTFSFTNGLTGVQTGSCNVITLNLNRIIQNWIKSIGGKVPTVGNWHDSLKFYLIPIIERVQKYHIAFKHNLYMFEKAGQLTASTAGYISMKKLYSTIGLNGINEAAMFLGIDVSYNKEYKDFCRLITGTISELNKKNSTPEYQFNQEFVPAEDLGSKNFNWDRQDGYWVPEDGRVLYNSYFYDAHNDTSVLDKLRMHGKEFTELLDGGVGCHINLEEHLSMTQYLKLIDFAIANGTSYFTFNIPNTQCDDCGFISKQRLKKCPKCGSEHLTWWTRVIGFLRPTKLFSPARRIEESQRTYSKEVD